jgi:hypothetical protein
MNKQFPDIEWNLADNAGNVETWERVQIAVMMDIRRELQSLNRLLACPNFTGIPETLRQIKRNTTKPRKRASKR